MAATASTSASAVELTDAIIARAQGCLIGQFVGDALGTRYEFKERRKVRSQMAKDRQEGFLPILGGSRFILEGVPINLKPGQVTDDTELAMALAVTLLEKKKYDQAAVACAYRHWLDSGPFDVGHTTDNAFTVPESVQGPEEVRRTILNQSKELNMGSLSNGCLMRISPLAIAGVPWTTEELVKCAKLDAQLTNPNIHAQVAVASYTTAVAELIRSGDTTRAFQTALKTAEESALITKFLQDAEENCEMVLLENGRPAEFDMRHMGYLGVAFQWAFCEMLHANSFEEGLERVISRGGDTDTNGCICGAMLGARFGADAIPQHWRKTVAECKQCREDVYPWVRSSNLPEVATNLLKLSAV